MIKYTINSLILCRFCTILLFRAISESGRSRVKNYISCPIAADIDTGIRNGERNARHRTLSVSGSLHLLLAVGTVTVSLPFLIHHRILETRQILPKYLMMARTSFVRFISKWMMCWMMRVVDVIETLQPISLPTRELSNTACIKLYLD